jgi:hypothetical protein
MKDENPGQKQLDKIYRESKSSGIKRGTSTRSTPMWLGRDLEETAENRWFFMYFLQNGGSLGWSQTL